MLILKNHSFLFQSVFTAHIPRRLMLCLKNPILPLDRSYVHHRFLLCPSCLQRGASPLHLKSDPPLSLAPTAAHLDAIAHVCPATRAPS